MTRQELLHLAITGTPTMKCTHFYDDESVSDAAFDAQLAHTHMLELDHPEQGRMVYLCCDACRAWCMRRLGNVRA